MSSTFRVRLDLKMAAAMFCGNDGKLSKFYPVYFRKPKPY
jgi:hypothetical protein